MGRCEKLLDRAMRNPAGLRVGELAQLAECHGFRFRGQRGSHVIYRRVGALRPLVLSGGRGMASGYQVRQVLKAIRRGEESSE